MNPATNTAVMALTPIAVGTSHSTEIELQRTHSALRRSRVCTDPISKEIALRAVVDHARRAALLVDQMKS